MARARNYLLTAALRDEHSWVLWLDVDLVEYPSTILEDLQSVNVDVVVPNCLRETDDNSFWGYDKNNWQETDRSLEIQKDLDPVSNSPFAVSFFLPNHHLFFVFLFKGVRPARRLVIVSAVCVCKKKSHG